LCILCFPYNRTLPIFKLLPAIEVACGERDGNIDKLIEKFNHKGGDSPECLQDADSEESR
jgi:hypothetical protein